MKQENYVRVIAGFFVFATALLGYFHHKYWLFATMFIGLNLLQFGFSNFCPLSIVLKKCGVRE